MCWQSNLISVLQGDEDLKQHASQPGHYTYWKRLLWKDSLQPR